MGKYRFFSGKYRLTIYVTNNRGRLSPAALEELGRIKEELLWKENMEYSHPAESAG